MLEILLLAFTLALLGVGFLLVRRPLSNATALPPPPWPERASDVWVKLTIMYQGKPLPLLLTLHELAVAKERAERQPELFDLIP